MHFRSRSLIAAIAAAGLALAGCASETTGSAAPQGGGPAVTTTDPGATDPGATDPGATDPGAADPTDIDTPGADPSASAPSGSGDTAAEGTAVDPAEFSSKLEAGMQSVTSLKARMDAGNGSMGGSGTVAQTMENGLLVAADMSIGVAGQNMNIRIVDGQVFIGGPAIAGVAPEAADKEWVLIDAGSSNKQIAMLANTLGSIISNAGTDSYVYMARAITDLDAQGTETIGSFETTKYQAVIDVQKMAEVLPESMKEYGTLLQASGLQEMQVLYWIDTENRMVQSETTVAAAGQSQTTRLTVESFNEPVDISLPDPATVYTG